MLNNIFRKYSAVVILIGLLTTVCTVVPAQDDQTSGEHRIVIDGREYYLHVVKPGEGFFALARRYNVSQQEIIEANPELDGGLKRDQVVRIPVIKGRNDNKTNIERSENYILHTVEKGQTAWYISRKYDVDVEDIYEHNAGSEKQLIVGSIIRVPIIKEDIDPDKQSVDKDFLYYEVQPGNTLYSLARRFNISVDDILDNNPALRDGSLLPGTLVRIPRVVDSADAAVQTGGTKEGMIQGEAYTYHEIRPGQTLYSISRLYQVDLAVIRDANPDVDTNDLKPGYMLRIPRQQKDESLASGQSAKDQDLFERHKVRRKETLFSISRQYNVDMETIRKVNPDVDFSNLKKGTELNIPKDQWFVQNLSGVDGEGKVAGTFPDSLKIERFIPSQYLCDNREGIGHARPARVALLLPFALDATDEANTIVKVENGDTIRTPRKYPVISRSSRIFVEFYEGVLLALDELKKQNININLSVYDISQHNGNIELLLKSNPELKEVDMIIGPARSDDLEAVSKFSIEHQIKLVYPLSNVNPVLDRNPYVFQVNTPDTLLFNKMTNEIVRQSESYNLLAIIPEGEDLYASAFMDELRQKVFFNEFSLNKDMNYREYRMMGKEDMTNLEALLDPMKKNFVVVPTNSEATLSKIVPTLAGIAEKGKVKISLFGMTEWLRAQSIEPEDMFTLNTQLFTFFAFDYESEKTHSFIEKYRNWYYTEPHAVSSYFQNSSSSSGYSRYGAWGYDVAYYFISSLTKRGEFFEFCPEPLLEVQPVQFNFSFKRISNWGGFYNDGIFLLKFLPGYKVTRTPVISFQPMTSIGEDGNIIESF
ncbi:LysM peptidoglycan-binding domain-containing protein [Marinilabilia sp.]|uniref:PBP1 and LysM peptidoglycan-binding domain-containing protein n=1 Tax=Marinilabilia sp. TaxID=2021252 RepID=UPI0025C61E98|nr:LysM peptidoglycan-binding domain-containing protein [Marinilabilia sp.]